MKTFGERLQWALNQRGWKTVKLASELDLDPDTPKRWAANLNRPGFEVIFPLADLLGVDARWLVTGFGEPYGQREAAQPDPPDPDAFRDGAEQGIRANEQQRPKSNDRSRKRSPRSQE